MSTAAPPPPGLNSGSTPPQGFSAGVRFGLLHPRTGGDSAEPIMTTPSSSSLADVIDTILDKGLVIDAYVRVSIVGIELLTIDARIVVASVDTYLRFAEAVNRLNISEQDPKADLPELVGDVTNKVTGGVAKHKTTGALDSAGEKLARSQRQASNADRGSARTREVTTAPKSTERVIGCRQGELSTDHNWVLGTTTELQP